MQKITCVVPCYNEQEALPYFYEEIKNISKKFIEEYQVQLEVLFINDGSKDDTLKLLMEIAVESHFIQYISFSRNFGKEAAIYAGLKHSKGDYVAVLDADMQDPPKLLLEMYQILQDKEYDSVATRRLDRKGEPPIRSFFARLFYKLINRMSDTDIVDGARDFRLMKRDMVDAILSMSEYNRFSKGIFGWVGFNTKWLPYENVERVAGDTKWSFWSLFKYSLEGIIAFSTIPLQLASAIGLIFCVIGFIAICFIIGRALLFGDPVAGWPSLATLIITMGGIQLFCTGILGQYLAKTYLETKNRPIYIISKTSIDDNILRE